MAEKVPQSNPDGSGVTGWRERRPKAPNPTEEVSTGVSGWRPVNRTPEASADSTPATPDGSGVTGWRERNPSAQTQEQTGQPQVAVEQISSAAVAQHILDTIHDSQRRS